MFKVLVLTSRRCVTVGFRFRPLYTSFLPSDEILPANDDSWDIGVSPLPAHVGVKTRFVD